MKIIRLLALAAISLQCASAQEGKRSFDTMQASLQPDEIITYKKAGGRELTLHIFHPEGFKASDQRPAFVAIHGGGWTNGTPRRFYPYAHALVGEDSRTLTFPPFRPTSPGGFRRTAGLPASVLAPA